MPIQRNFVSDKETEKILKKLENMSEFIREAIKEKWERQTTERGVV